MLTDCDDHLFSTINAHQYTQSTMDQNSHLTSTSGHICQVSDCVTIRNLLRYVIECGSVKNCSRKFIIEPKKKVCLLFFSLVVKCLESGRSIFTRSNSFIHHRCCFVHEILSTLYNGRSSSSFSTLKNQVHNLEMNAHETATTFEDYFKGLVERVYTIRLGSNNTSLINVSSPLEANTIASAHEDLNKLITFPNSVNSSIESKVNN